MNVFKTDEFIRDVEAQVEWYANTAGWEVADRYLSVVEATTELLARLPLLGPAIRTNHPRLRGWRSFLVARPFQRHILFYEVADGNVLFRRAMHGHRDLPRRLMETPKNE